MAAHQCKSAEDVKAEVKTKPVKKTAVKKATEKSEQYIEPFTGGF